MNLSFVNGTAQQRAWCQKVIDESHYPFSTVPTTVTVEWVADPSKYGAHTAFAYTTTSADGMTATTKIRADIGGQGSDYRFFEEVWHHELGHVVLSYRGATAGISVDQIVVLFTRNGARGTIADWNQSTNWADRINEATTEVFKDVFAPNHLWFNRTNWTLPEASFKAWLGLYGGSGGTDDVLPLDAAGAIPPVVTNNVLMAGDEEIHYSDNGQAVPMSGYTEVDLIYNLEPFFVSFGVVEGRERPVGVAPNMPADASAYLVVNWYANSDRTGRHERSAVKVGDVAHPEDPFIFTELGHAEAQQGTAKLGIQSWANSVTLELDFYEAGPAASAPVPTVIGYTTAQLLTADFVAAGGVPAPWPYPGPGSMDLAAGPAAAVRPLYTGAQVRADLARALARVHRSR